MKNKKSIYILLPVALIVWGLIGYKIYAFISSKDELDSKSLNTVIQQEDEVLEDAIEYKLLLDYPDPFFRKSNHKTTAAKKVDLQSRGVAFQMNENTSTVTTKQNSNKKAIQLQDVKYMGCIVNKENNKTYACLNYKGISYMLCKNEKFENLIMRAIHADSVSIEMANKKHTIQRK